MPLLISPFFTFLSLSLPLLTCSSPLPQTDPSPCTAYPTWSVSDFSSTAADAVGNNSGAKATFKLTNNLTSVTDEITCSLQVNYRCIINGTPSDKDLIIHLGVRAGTLTLGLDRVVAGCPGRDGPLHVIGTGELGLVCEGEGHGEVMTCTLDEADKKNIIEGAAVELAPEK
ncbi:hypothetical protein QBC34DRAFT_428881 [Podospora aff. communis PSN243]|uniref:AA1-like domain-containing protein n=1 Tax=Podospora aff. communis PSN243 TaxID=3040156 RepID=A0AAV9GF22_9PEZI|nr:hypothetical protein QBC34DRAFT_428881 [Podospora aff. communis PSN243]